MSDKDEVKKGLNELQGDRYQRQGSEPVESSCQQGAWADPPPQPPAMSLFGPASQTL